MRVGDAVRIRECGSMPEVVGKNGEIVDMEMQQFAKYTAYPIWVKITSGERAEKVYGFREGEVELLPVGFEVPEVGAKEEAGTVSTKVTEQMEEILKGVATVEELDDIERIIGEVKGKLLAEPVTGFWEGKTPCWEMFRCPEAVRDEWPAFKYRSLPCWEIEGTYCKLDNYGTTGQDTAICEMCRVYKRWGHGEPIEIKLLGRGIDTSLASLLGHTSPLGKDIEAK